MKNQEILEEHHRYAIVRNDLIEQALSVPVGDSYYDGSVPLRYRWINDDTFQVYLGNKWQDADSIDWVF